MGTGRRRQDILSSTDKPKLEAVDPAGVPEDLKALHRWIGWKFEWSGHGNGGNGKWEKRPVHLKTGAVVSATDPANWFDFYTAHGVAAFNELGIDGVGVVLGDLGDGRTLAGIDIDDCRDLVTGELTGDAATVVAATEIYFEVSPTGTGIKGLCIGTKPPEKCSNGEYEIYDHGRFFIVTGHTLPDSPAELREATEALAWFHLNYIQPTPDMKTPSDQRALAVQTLNRLNPNRAHDYHQWIAVGMALRSVSDDLLSEWIEWSKQSSKYKEGECAGKWASFDGSGVGLGSLIKWAKEDEVTVSEPKFAFNVLSSAELANGNFEIEFLIDQMIVAGQPLIIAGPPKTLKTSIMIAGAIALSTGSPFLGKFPVKRACRVCIMSGESGVTTLRETAERICASGGLNLSDLSNLKWTDQVPQFGSAAQLAALDELLREHQVEVLFVDPAYLAMPGADAANLMIQGNLLRSVNEVCRRHGVTMALVHHTRKNTIIGRPLDLNDIAWAGFGEFARQWWLIGRSEPFNPMDGHRLLLSAGGSAGHSSSWAMEVVEGRLDLPGGRIWEVEVKPPGEAQFAARVERENRQRGQREEKAAEEQKRMQNVLDGYYPDGLTKTRLRTEAKIGANRIDAAIKRALAARKIEEWGVITGNQTTPKSGYRSAQPPAVGQ